MNSAFSVYLDLVRFAAAFLVYLYHSNQRWLIEESLPMGHYGHAAVIVFFVLSGFVIAWVTDTKENSWPVYAASRLSRVFSVVIPALVLCVVLDGVGRSLNPAIYAGYPFDQLVVRLVASLAMVNEVWFVSITSLSNVPFWSITYEFWYYVLFALVTFLPRGLGLWAAALLLLGLGPKIALLAPIWIAGVVLYRWQALQRLPVRWSWVLVVASSVLIVALHAGGQFDAISTEFEKVVGAQWYRELTFSKFFVADYLLATLVFCNFAGMRVVAPQIARVFASISAPVKWLAGYTFTFYLLHQPLFLFWGSLVRMDRQGTIAWWTVTALTLGSVFVIGQLTEQRRPWLRRWLLGQLVALQQTLRGDERG